VRRIWVDADACPGPIKDSLFRAAERTKTPLTMVTNHPLPHYNPSLISNTRVASGLDDADDFEDWVCRNDYLKAFYWMPDQ